jgi:hypothetical protein
VIVNFWWKLDVTNDILYYVCEYFNKLLQILVGQSVLWVNWNLVVLNSCSEMGQMIEPNGGLEKNIKNSKFSMGQNYY